VKGIVMQRGYDPLPALWCRRESSCEQTPWNCPTSAGLPGFHTRRAPAAESAVLAAADRAADRAHQIATAPCARDSLRRERPNIPSERGVPCARSRIKETVWIDRVCEDQTAGEGGPSGGRCRCDLTFAFDILNFSLHIKTNFDGFGYRSFLSLDCSSLGGGAQ